MNFDLHIHSSESKYKEGAGIVDESNVENVDILLKKLEENQVGLFSITDHNRFNIELYKVIDEKLKKQKYEHVKNIVAGVEFDVQIDPDMKKCHIITIFDANNDIHNYTKIKDGIATNLLTSADQYYTREEFENVLKTIGLDVILIACQRNSLDSKKGKHNSLNESTNNPEELLSTGYISALEFQKPHVEGILKNNLKQFSKSIGLVTGSDCHDWNEYPNHSKNKANKNFKHSRAKILATFKGLVMAFTSPNTRINRIENTNMNYIKNFQIRENEVLLENGINAIIGENGSGKSSLLSLLYSSNKMPRYAKNLINHNNMKCDHDEISKKLFISQGEIVKNYESNKLFPEDNFSPIDNTEFINAYKLYANSLLKYIKNNIKRKERINNLAKRFFKCEEMKKTTTYFIDVNIKKNYEDVDNPHSTHRIELKKLLVNLKNISENEYYKKYTEEIKQATNIFNVIYEEIKNQDKKLKLESRIKNSIVSAVTEYKRRFKYMSTSEDISIEKQRKDREVFINEIIDAIKQNVVSNKLPIPPSKISGCTSNPKNGFNFNSETNYNSRNPKDVHEFLLKTIFNKNYQNIDNIKQIDTTEELNQAITKNSSCSSIEEHYNYNLNKFLEEMCDYKNHIVDIKNSQQQIAGTLGELSLAYLKYIVHNEDEKCIFLFDQPEDHISNNNISRKLIEYVNSIRNEKQVILVTHNPLLVVNLDVDQVIFVEKNNEKINVIAGCLEYESEDVNILELIAEHMDGGKDSIERRLKVYG